LQDGFIKVFTKLHQYKQDGDLGAWIIRIMVNSALLYLQKHNRYKKDFHLEDIMLHSVNDDNPSINLNIKAIANIIRDLLLGYQTIFNLVSIKSYNHLKVSKMLNTNTNYTIFKYEKTRAKTHNCII